jgi:hypothetical protein
MLDIFKSGVVKRTVRNGAICLDSHGGSGVSHCQILGRTPITCGAWFSSPGGQAQDWSSQPSGALGGNALVVVVIKEAPLVV